MMVRDARSVQVAQAVILAAGEGTRMWPYAVIRPKAMLPVANQPLIRRQVGHVRAAGVRDVVVAAGRYAQQIRGGLGDDGPIVVEVTGSGGTADTLGQVRGRLDAGRPVLILYGDMWLSAEDLTRLVSETPTDTLGVLVDGLRGRPAERFFGLTVEPETGVTQIFSHPRDGINRVWAGALLAPPAFLQGLARHPGRHLHTQVGAMPPVEVDLWEAVAQWRDAGEPIQTVDVASPAVDCDMPWDFWEANMRTVAERCAAITTTELAAGASIHPEATVRGHVVLGEGSSIGARVVIEGNAVVGAHTVIDNGAILRGQFVIGNDVCIEDYCLLTGHTVIGDQATVRHGAEFDGVAMRGVYLYHYMEYSGVIGEGTDLGAATVTGTLRFDDGQTRQRVRGTYVAPPEANNGVFLGDHCRTGVNAILMPGVKVGVYSVVGAGVVLQRDVPDRTMVTVQQEQIQKPWGPTRYNW